MPATLAIDISPFDAPLGAEVTGLDLAQPLDDAGRDVVLAAWHTPQVLVFRDQDLTPEQQVAFTARLATPGRPRLPRDGGVSSSARQVPSG